MARLVPGLFGLALLVLWIWAVLDVIATDRALIRSVHKVVWLVLVIFVPTLGAVAWLALGRPVNAGFTPGAAYSRAPGVDRKPAPRGLEDSEAWSASTTRSAPAADGFESTAAKERRLRELEAELAEREAELDEDD
jgi:hypothetical protein